MKKQHLHHEAPTHAPTGKPLSHQQSRFLQAGVFMTIGACLLVAGTVNISEVGMMLYLSLVIAVLSAFELHAPQSQAHGFAVFSASEFATIVLLLITLHLG